MKVSPCFSTRLFFRGIVPFFHPPLLGIRQLKFSFYLPCPDRREEEEEEEEGEGTKKFRSRLPRVLAGKTLLSPLFPLFCNCFPPFFSPPPFLVLFFPLLFFLTLFLRSSSLVRSFHRVETSPRGSITRLFSPLPPSAAAFRLFALLRVVNRVATACKTDYAPFQLLPLEILDKSLIDLPSPLL